jgi:hypothetical protein
VTHTNNKHRTVTYVHIWSEIKGVLIFIDLCQKSVKCVKQAGALINHRLSIIVTDNIIYTSLSLRKMYSLVAFQFIFHSNLVFFLLNDHYVASIHEV